MRENERGRKRRHCRQIKDTKVVSMETDMNREIVLFRAQLGFTQQTHIQKFEIASAL